MRFEFIDSQMIYRGRVFNLIKAHLRLPNGETSYYDLVKHPGAVTIVPLDHKGNILFVEQYRAGADAELLELPAGVLGQNEDPDVCASREIREETGMAANNLKKIGEFFLTPGYSNEFMHVYIASSLYPAPLQQDEDEFITTRSIPIQDAVNMAMHGKIKDANTLAALFLAQPFLKF
jgi:ADP-ribose pyrophosphatase